MIFKTDIIPFNKAKALETANRLFERLFCDFIQFKEAVCLVGVWVVYQKAEIRFVYQKNEREETYMKNIITVATVNFTADWGG